uniref:Uncharacterized protein n=1 Tax=Romanomermis culicivorax TaxID=13658 RepID=A0A915J3R6_ROMCU
KDYPGYEQAYFRDFLVEGVIDRGNLINAITVHKKLSRVPKTWITMDRGGSVRLKFFEFFCRDERNNLRMSQNH